MQETLIKTHKKRKEKKKESHQYPEQIQRLRF